jgi:hypothetical protein
MHCGSPICGNFICRDHETTNLETWKLSCFGFDGLLL